MTRERTRSSLLNFCVDLWQFIVFAARPPPRQPSVSPPAGMIDAEANAGKCFSTFPHVANVAGAVGDEPFQYRRD